MGRLTLDPRVHLDPLGSILLFVTFVFTSFGFGWAKPTPYNPMNLEGGRWGEAIVGIAGPISNLVMALAAALPARYLLANPALIEQVPSIVLLALDSFIFLNLILMVFNLLPIPPLDGSKVLFALLPRQTAWRYRPILEQYGFVLLLLIFFLPPGDSIGGRVIGPVLNGLYGLLVGI
jgi:Zn-dependent protease